MSIINININNYKQDFEVDEFYKMNYGGILTSYYRIEF